MMKKCVAATVGIGIAVVAVGLSSCTTTFPDDLSAVSISKIPRADLTRVVGGDATLPLFSRGDEFLVVRISTRENVLAYAAKRHSTLALNSWFCDNRMELRTGPWLYVQGRELRDPQRAKPIEPTAAGSYEFDTVHLILWTGQLEGYPPYDLRSAEQDICLQLGGTNMAFTFESNVVRIAGKQIEAAIGQ